MRYAFVDVSGTVAVYKDSHFFVTAIISLDQPRVIFQRYERDDSRVYDLIADRLVVEEMIERDLW